MAEVADSLAPLSALAPALLGRDLSQRERDAFGKYLELLIKWQRVHRLVGSPDPRWITEHLLIDSLLFLCVLPPMFRTMLDLGSGAGIPGIPLKLVKPEARLTMIESRQRRASFLATAVRELGISDATVVARRAEDVVDALAGSFDVVVFRCAGDPSELLPLAKRFLAPGGFAVASGPPIDRSLSVGEWVDVDTPTRLGRRKFAMLRV